MTDKKSIELQDLILKNFDKLDERMQKLEDRATNIEKCVAKITAENKIILGGLLLFLGSIIGLAFKVLS